MKNGIGHICGTYRGEKICLQASGGDT